MFIISESYLKLCGKMDIVSEIGSRRPSLASAIELSAIYLTLAREILSDAHQLPAGMTCVHLTTRHVPR